jgi:hypothetical protein
MPAAYSAWGNMGGGNYALPMVRLTPVVPETQGYLLAWSTVDQGLDYAPISIDFASGDATSAGNFGVAAGKAYKVNAIQVVGARVTGWAAPTGNTSRATFDTTTVTTAQLAERLKALIDDLTTHGLIGT